MGNVGKSIPDAGNDNVDNWPEFCEKRNRCRICPVLSSVYRTKCKMCLCFKNDTAFMIATTRDDMCQEYMNLRTLVLETCVKSEVFCELPFII